MLVHVNFKCDGISFLGITPTGKFSSLALNDLASFPLLVLPSSIVPPLVFSGYSVFVVPPRRKKIESSTWPLNEAWRTAKP